MYEKFEREKIILDSTVCYKWKGSEANAVILFIHGLGGNPEGTWVNLPNLIMGTAYARHTDLIAYSYKTSSIKFGSPSISSLTKDFITFCETVIEQYERVYIISHSLGAVLALNAIPKLNRINERWDNKIRGHILLAPALWGSLLGWVSLSKTSRELKYGSPVLKNTRRNWLEYVSHSLIKSFVVFGSKDGVIKKKETELKRLNIFPKSVAKGHIKISKINAINEITYRAIMNCLYMFDDSNHYDSRSYILRSVFDSRKQDWEHDDFRSEFIYIPNFTIRIVELNQRAEGGSFVEPWVKKFPDPNGIKYNYAIYYLSYRIYAFSMISCDGYRYLIPMPKSRTDLVISKNQYALGKIMESAGMYDNLDQGLQMAGIIIR